MVWLLIPLAAASELVVRLDGPDPDPSGAACRLYDADSAAGFPGGETLRQVRATVDASGQPVCRFRGLGAGRYAVAAIVDLNGNQVLDTTSWGLPREPWGVSNNARPAFRAPTFEEAALWIPADGDVETRLVLMD